MPTSLTSSRIQVRASAPPNIALVKYWGKRDERLNLPAVDSLSVCLDGPRTTVSVQLSDQLQVVFNDRPLPAPLLPPYRRLLDALPEPMQPLHVSVSTDLPVAAGLAGSAAVMAALAVAADELAQTGLSPDALGALARQGSGSAARSVPDGFCYWARGTAPDGSDSFAQTVAPPGHWPELRICAVLLERGTKAVSSTAGMEACRETASLYETWVTQTNDIAPAACEALLARDFVTLGRIASAQATLLHATCLTASPPILYLSRGAIDLVRAVSARLTPDQCFVTFDAGTNPIFFTQQEFLPRLEATLDDLAPHAPRLVAQPGKGARLEAEEGTAQ